MGKLIRFPNVGLTVKEVALHLSVTESTIRRWVKKGIIPAKCYWITKDKKIFFDHNTMHDWFALCKGRDEYGKLIEPN